MTFAFTIIPVSLVHHLGMDENRIWIVFASSAIIGLFMIAPGMIISEKYKKPKGVLLFAVVLFGLAYILMGFGDTKQNLVVYAVGVVLFFGAFCLQEPILQNLASKYPKMQEKSLSLGIFTTFGYLGSFFGGIVGGRIFNQIDFMYIAIFLFIFMIVWFFVLILLHNPSVQENLYIALKSDFSTLTDTICQIDVSFGDEKKSFNIDLNEKKGSKHGIVYAISHILEASIPLKNFKSAEKIYLEFKLIQNGVVIEKAPLYNAVEVNIADDFKEEWIV